METSVRLEKLQETLTLAKIIKSLERGISDLETTMWCGRAKYVTQFGSKLRKYEKMLVAAKAELKVLYHVA